MSLRPIVALAALAALALPAAALADGGPGGASPPECAAGQVPSAAAPCRAPVCPPGATAPRGEGRPAPCAVRICAAGQTSTADVPCLQPCAPGVRPTADAPCAPVPGTQPSGDKGDAQPQGDDTSQPGGEKHAGAGANANANGVGSLTRRIWRVTGEADGFDTTRHALSLVADSISGVPARVAAKLQAVLGDQADVLVSAQTRVLDAGGHRLAGDAAAAALDAADSVKVTGKLAPTGAWAKDQDGQLVPAVRALRVKILG
jgi:hypothetical protein